MLRPAGWYKRRLPWIGQPPPPSQLPPPHLVVSLPSVRRPGVVVLGRVPPYFVPPPAVRPLQALVISTSATRPGRVIWERCFLKKPNANVAGGLLPALVRRFEPPLRAREARTVLTRLPGPATGVAAPAQRQWWLRASVATQWQLKANVQTAWALKASAVMSISAKLTFFQGEDVTLNFALTPPQDMTGWTLTGTIKNQLGGTTQFTFTPTILDTGRGTFQAVWSRTNTTNLTPGDYVWDIRRTDSGNNSVLAHGEITVKQPVTA